MKNFQVHELQFEYLKPTVKLKYSAPTLTDESLAPSSTKVPQKVGLLPAPSLFCKNLGCNLPTSRGGADAMKSLRNNMNLVPSAHNPLTHNSLLLDTSKFTCERHRGEFLRFAVLRFLRELIFADYSLERKLESFCELFDLCFSHLKKFCGNLR